jgi:hypothetical protein
MSDLGNDRDVLLTPELIRELLVELGDELANAGQVGELFIVGGAALALGYRGRESTHDIDGLFAVPEL